jgi:hypothetical protein
MWTAVSAEFNRVMTMLLNTMLLVGCLRVKVNVAPLAVMMQAPVSTGVAEYTLLHSAFSCPKLSGTVVETIEEVEGAAGGAGGAGSGPVCIMSW